MSQMVASPRPPECKLERYSDNPCPHLQERGGGMRGERYLCDRCGVRFFLDYEEMR